LTATEQRFVDLITDPKDKSGANIFFADLHLSYEQALSGINVSAHSSPHLTLASFPQKSKSQYPIVAEYVFGVFAQNELAYNLVADTKSLYFNLEVRTFPEGAKVSYGRRGDQRFEDLQDTTNSVIKSLPYARWIVRFQKPGYAIEEREHNPYTETNHVVTVELTPEKK